MKKFFDNEILMAEIAGWLREGKTVTIPVKGNSMKPFLTDGRDKVTLCSCRAEELSPGDVVLAGVNDGGSTVLHRVVERRGTRLLLQGDANETTEERLPWNAKGGRMKWMESFGAAIRPSG